MPGRNLPAKLTEPSPVLDPEAVRVPTSHQLPPHRTQAGRIGDHLAAISADLREWTELRIELVQRQVEGVVGILDRVKHYAEAAKFLVPAAVLALVGVLFLLVALALGLGALVGSLWLGFLLLTVVLLGTAGLFGWIGVRRVREAEALVVEARKAARDEARPSRETVQDAERLRARTSAV